MKRIAPSILSADFSRLGEEIKAVEEAGADWIHVDVMDGHFVPNITMGPVVVEAVKRSTHLPVDVHLMIAHPERYISEFADSGADWITVQVEACVHLNRIIQMIKERDRKAGVVLNPSTPLSEVDWILEDVDLVMIMSVNPGFGGQKFIRSSLDKIRALHDMIREKGLSLPIEVDGGVNDETIESVSKAGADVFVAGSAIFGSANYKETISRFREKIS